MAVAVVHAGLVSFKEKIETAVSMVPAMCAEEKLRAVQLWNILSEKLQEIVNSSATDINALAFHPDTSNYYLCTQPKSAALVMQQEQPDLITGKVHHQSPPETDVDNSLASFSDIQCNDEESADVDNVCPLTLAHNPETMQSTFTESIPDHQPPPPPPAPEPQVSPACDDKARAFECPECGASFRTKGHLIDHSRKHTGERPFQCTLCDRSFTTHSNLKRHIKSHTGHKTWACQECGDKFLEKKTLLVHIRRHTGEKPYRCDLCDKSFAQLSILNSHVALHDDQRRHSCELCGKSFRQKAQMKTHMLRHKGERRFHCQQCPQSFLTKSDFRRHLRVHTGERPFPCDLCPKKFGRLETLNEHKNRHYGLKPYACTICDKESSAHSKHVKKHSLADANKESKSLAP